MSGGEDRKLSPDLLEDDYRGVEIFPPQGSSNGKTYRNTWYEDDGIAAEPSIARFAVTYSCTKEIIFVELDTELDGYVPQWKGLSIILPVGDKRAVMGRDKENLAHKVDARGRLTYTLEMLY